LTLEKQVLEIASMFKDLSVMVDQQSESLDVIEDRIVRSRHWVERGQVDVQQAERYQSKARSRQCCCLVVVLVIAVVILAPVLTSSLRGG
jgi:t-SNARE complex subunit (syntaxin)